MNARASVSFSRPLAARLLPLLSVATVALTFAAPVAFFVLGMDALREGAGARAREIASLFASEVEDRPRLWRYDTLNLLEHVRVYRAQADVERVEVADERGAPIDLGGARSELSSAELVWADAPIVLSGRPVGHVWVALSSQAVERRALLLLLPFGAMALVLTLLLYVVPVRTARSAERRIRALVDRLEGAQRRLEGLLGVHEEERRHIARELHDSLGQSLTAMRIQLQIMASRREASVAPEAITRLVEASDTMLEEMRRALALLGPAVLVDTDLGAALTRLADGVRERTGAEVELGLSPRLTRETFSPALEAAIYRIAQEALANAERHASAKHIHLRVEVESTRVRVVVLDDGVGFDRTAPRAGQGLKGMSERAALFDGALEIETMPGEGTRLVVELSRASTKPSRDSRPETS